MSTLFCSLTALAQTSKREIIYSQNSSEIENFLRTAHPEDPRRPILKSRLISLKNAKWMEQGRVSYNSLTAVLPKNKVSADSPPTHASTEKTEYEKLMQQNEKNHSARTVKLLNKLFDSDRSDPSAILLVQNGSDCDIIVRVRGAEMHDLPVPAHGENSVVIAKGSYELRSFFCGKPYAAAKDISKNTIVALNTRPALNFAGIQRAPVSGQ